MESLSKNRGARNPKPIVRIHVYWPKNLLLATRYSSILIVRVCTRNRHYDKWIFGLLIPGMRTLHALALYTNVEYEKDEYTQRANLV